MARAWAARASLTASARSTRTAAWYHPRVSDAFWSRLAAAFPAAAVAWTPVEIAASGDQVRVVARLAGEAVRERLDQVAGVAGWSTTFVPFDGGAVACHLTIAGVTKGAVAAPALHGGAAVTAEHALAESATAFGMRPPVVAVDEAWVACDPESGAPLHPPDVVPRPDVTARSSAPAAPPVAAPVVDLPPRVPETQLAAPRVARTESPPGPAAAPETQAMVEVAGDGKPAGQQMIDRLVERLKEEGHGLQAARLLVRYGGYGKDPEAARELYAQLRALLRQAAVDAGRDGAP